MVKKGGLGKGLEALFSDVSMSGLPIKTENEAQSLREGVLEVKLNEIDTNPAQPRKQFDAASLEELAASLKQSGVIQPLIVRKNGERYIIIAGERRYRAARIAGLETIPVLVRDYKDDEIMEVALIENIQRADLNPIEEAAGIKLLMEQHDLTQEEVAERLGKSRPSIANSVRLLTLSEPVLAYLRAGRLSAGHARCLVAVEDKPLQAALAERIVTEQLSVRQTELLVKQAAEQKKPPKQVPRFVPEMFDLEEKLKNKLETKVKLSGTMRQGKIIIEYFTQEQLEGLFDYLTR